MVGKICACLIATSLLFAAASPDVLAESELKPAPTQADPLAEPSSGEDPIKELSEPSEEKIPDPEESAGAEKEKKKEKKDTKAADDKNGAYAEEAVKRYNKGVELHQSGFFNQAIAQYKLAIKADKRMEEAYSNLGLIYASQHNYSKAIKAFKKALELKPGRPITLNGLGTVLYARGKAKEAIEKWREAIAINPGFTSAYFNMGTALEHEKDEKGAMEAYVRAIKTNPKMATAYYRAGSMMNKDKHPAQANLLLTKAVQLEPAGDFVKDARKQLSKLKNDFTKTNNSKQPEVKMNILPPPSNGDSSDQDGNENE